MVWARLVVGEHGAAAALSPSREARALELLEARGPRPYRRRPAGTGPGCLPPAARGGRLPLIPRRRAFSGSFAPTAGSTATPRARRIAGNCSHTSPRPCCSPDEILSEARAHGAPRHASRDDPVALRRHLIDADLLTRTPSGPSTGFPTRVIRPDVPRSGSGLSPRASARRRAGSRPTLQAWESVSSIPFGWKHAVW